MIIDAGGGTVDLSSFKFTSTDPVSVEEISPSACRLLVSGNASLR